jgi:hypothetical protein
MAYSSENAIPTFYILHNALKPLRGKLLDKESLREEILFVVGFPAINGELNKLESYMVELCHQKCEIDKERHFKIMYDYFNKLRQIFNDGLLINWWYSDEISLFEDANLEIYHNIMDTFSQNAYQQSS